MHTINILADLKLGPDEAAYLQIANHVRILIATGKLRPGARLPAIREAARNLGIDPGTVARAYRVLANDGAISGRPGHGSFVSGGSGRKDIAERQQNRLEAAIERAVLEGLALGFTIEDIETSFTLRLAGWRERRGRPRSERPAAPHSMKEVRFRGSHDLAIELLGNHLSTLHPSLHLAAAFVGSLAGLVALECGQADIAGAHLFDQETGEFNIPFVRRLMPGERVILLNLMERVQGLMVARSNPKHIVGLEDLVRPDVTIVNRQKGSGTRILLDSRLLKMGIAGSRVKGYAREEKTHMAVASLVSQGKADAGMGAQSAANLAGLDFIPLLKERYDLIALETSFARPPLERIPEIVRSDGFRNMLRSLPGYDISGTGQMITVAPHPGGA
ncbi:MAG: GntR family transcriptional regulator [Chloroflexi bacterium]|nr:GntR family transcriptional regulator [Chloroflexota bacterium]